MKHQILYALNVTDDETYGLYRKEMTPILKKYGGGFDYDFKVSETLKSEVSHPINRVFIIYFGSIEQKEKFLNDPEYQEIKKRLFIPSVEATAMIGTLAPATEFF